MRSKSAAFVAALFTFAISVVTAVTWAQEYDLSWHTIDGGGVIKSTGGDFELSGTIGQSDAGVMDDGVEGGYTLTGGFWFEIPPGDCEEDGDVDLYDQIKFTGCATGPLTAPALDCRCFDVNHSGTVDVADWAVMQTTFTGM